MIKFKMSGGERYVEKVLKIVVFDGGMGGEFFADRLEAELPVVEIIRVIDWHGAEQNCKSPRDARKIAEQALRPYIGKVDLIILANYLLSTTSLNYFRKKYQRQKFIGLEMRSKHTLTNRKTLIVTTKATTKSFEYFAFAHRVKAKTVCIDELSVHIDDDEPFPNAVQKKLGNFSPTQILLFCGQFAGHGAVFREVFGHNVRIVDGYDDAIRNAFRTLKIRGGTGKKYK